MKGSMLLLAAIYLYGQVAVDGRRAVLHHGRTVALVEVEPLTGDHVNIASLKSENITACSLDIITGEDKQKDIASLSRLLSNLGNRHIVEKVSFTDMLEVIRICEDLSPAVTSSQQEPKSEQEVSYW